MARQAQIIDQIRDYAGNLWDVRELRPTPHGWPVLLGWPAGLQRGKGTGGPRVIITRELAAYLQNTRLAPGKIDLPLSRNAIKRLRKSLGLNWREDNNAWWEDNPDGPGKSAGARSMRRKLRGEKSKLWSAEDDALALTLRRQGMSTVSISQELGRSASAVRSRLWRLSRQVNSPRSS